MKRGAGLWTAWCEGLWEWTCQCTSGLRGLLTAALSSSNRTSPPILRTRTQWREGKWEGDNVWKRYSKSGGDPWVDRVPEFLMFGVHAALTGSLGLSSATCSSCWLGLLLGDGDMSQRWWLESCLGIVTVDNKGMKKFYEMVAYLFFAWCVLNVSMGCLPKLLTGT